MKILALAVTAALACTTAQAANRFPDKRYDVGQKTCGEIHRIIASDGAAVIHYRSPRSGRQLYDRFVADSSFCQAYNYTDRTSIPTADNPSCPVEHCMRDSNSPTYNH